MLQLKERNLSKALIETVLNDPDEKVSGSRNRIIYQKLFEGKLLRVITEGNLLITAYMTDKIAKYTKGVT